MKFKNKKELDESNIQNLLSTEYKGIEKLEKMEDYLKSYNKFLVKKLIEIGDLKSSNKIVLDFGAGLGGIAKEIFKLTGIKPHCSEIDSKMCKELKEFGFDLVNILNNKYEYDFIYSSNVLEHIENDSQTLINLMQILKKNGIIVIYVPAFMILYSKFDSSIGHFRRYSKKELILKAKFASLKVEDIYYVDSIGFMAAYVSKILTSKTKLETYSKATLLIYDRLIFPFSRLLDKAGLKYLFGKNLLIILRK